VPQPESVPPRRPDVRPDLCVVIPAYNERANVAPMIERLDAALAGLAWECVYVDDNSPDGTARAVRAAAEHDRRVRCIVRVGRRGLASAVIEGVMASDAPVIACIDADLQHDETVLPKLYAAVAADGAADVAVASRYVEGGGTGDWDAAREKASRFATRVAALIGPPGLSDPMSGCFAAKREAFEGAVQAMSGKGYKILLDLFAASPRPLTFAEVAYTFRTREAGESKMSLRVLWDYLLMLVDHTVGKAVPSAYLVALGGFAASVAAHLALTAVLHAGLGAGFAAAHGTALAAVLVLTFALAEAMAHRPRKGAAWLRGLAAFAAAAAPGWALNGWLGVAAQAAGVAWPVAALAGAATGAAWSIAVLGALRR
jgi:dolichol-phosphate mannosyltransferase